MVKGRERRCNIAHSGHVVGKARVCSQPIFSHLEGTDMSYNRFKLIKELGVGDKRYA
jgi:hypothetical protein